MMTPAFTPSEFVAIANQALEFAFPLVEVEGEVLNFKISKNRWVYFDIADEGAKIRCFGTVYMLPAPVEDGMTVRINAAPRLHPQFGFSLNLQTLQFSGEGTIKKASNILATKLEAEGLFAQERKRTLPYPPEKIALITSEESAAYKDFVKVLSARYGGIQIEHADIVVQGESAPGQIVRAIEWFNKQADIADVIVVIRGGGSADDLQAFSSEQVTRAIAASRIPTLVALGHEVDISLAELAADQRASTPSNAAELLVPDRRDIIKRLMGTTDNLHDAAQALVQSTNQNIEDQKSQLNNAVEQLLKQGFITLEHLVRTLEALSPRSILKRGYAIVRHNNIVLKNAAQLKKYDTIHVQFSKDEVIAEVQ